MSLQSSCESRGAYRRFKLQNLDDCVAEISRCSHMHAVESPDCPGRYRIVQETLHNSCSSTFTCALDCECQGPRVDIETHTQKAQCSVTGKYTCTAQPLAVLSSLGCGGTNNNLNWHAAGGGSAIMDGRTFAHEEHLWHQSAVRVLREQHKKHLLLEAAHAIQTGNFCADRSGNEQPAICVILDGVFSKRSYGGTGKMDSQCAAGTVFGAETGMAVAHECLSRYNRQERTGKKVACDCGDVCCQPAVHFKCDTSYFQGKAGAMEPEAIGRSLCYISALGTAVVPCKCCLDHGVIQSVDDCQEHDPSETPWTKLLVTEFVGDGDSTVAAKIAQVYTECAVTHSRCKNHLVKNQGSHMYKLVVLHPAFAKPAECGVAALTSKFIRNLSTTTSTFISHHHKLWEVDHDHQHVLNLRADLMNLILHKTGSHDHCDVRYCTFRQAAQGGAGPEVAVSSAPAEPLVLPEQYLPEMIAIMKLTADKSSELIKFKTTNVAECGNQGIQVMTQGKGKNLIQGTSWESRVVFSMLRQIFGAAWVLVFFEPAFLH